MLGFVERLSAFFGRANEKDTGGPDRLVSAFSADKAKAIDSYAEFCRQGTIPAYPLEIFLEISNICDLKCAMCVQFSGLNAHRLEMIKGTARGFMEQDEVSENLKQALQHALLVHCFGYGEPTIHPSFKAFLDLISRYEVMIDFFTNGMHLDEDFCQFLVDRRIYQITVSFSGATKEVYESIYLGGNFERVLGGIKRLAEIKRSRGARYPIIEVNSLAFRDHVAHFDDFASLMADHGVDVVMLKPLQPHKTIPELYEHVSIMRARHEGKVIKRAIKIGQSRGVTVNADLYVRRAAANDLDHDQQLSALKAEAGKAFGPRKSKFGSNPISQFGAIAEDLQPIRNSDKEKTDPRVLGLDAPKAIARSLLKVRPLQEVTQSSTAFHCMEPFKTLYISRNGAVKPCCFSNPEGWYLGDAKKDDVLSVWRGEGFQTTRFAIAQDEYPMKGCEVCIRRQSGPQGHFTLHLVNNYFGWHGRNFDQNLPRLLESQSPGALRSIGTRDSIDLMRKVRRACAVEAPEEALDRVWPLEQNATGMGEFVATRSGYLHRDFVLPEASLGRPLPGASADVSPELLRLLRDCAARHYVGNGAIVDLGLASQAMQAFVAGLTSKPQIDAIVAAFESKRDKLIERFGLVAGANDIPGTERYIKTFVGNASDIRWLNAKTIEICLVQGGTRAGPFQRALRDLLPFFVPGETIVIQSNFYLQTQFYPKVLMGYLAGSFDWLGQTGLNAIFRYSQPISPDFAGLDPYPALPPDLCLRFHRRWHDANLPRTIQMRLDLSYANLLAEVEGPSAGLAHVERMKDEYGDLLRSSSGQENAYAKMIARVLQAFEATA